MSKGSIVFISFDDLVMKFARSRDNDLADYSILIASHELAGSLKLRSAAGVSGPHTGITYESKYDNIEFVDSIRPTAQIMEYAFDGDRVSFIERYEQQLLSSEPFSDLCAIVDMAVNSECDILIVMASYEFSAKIPQIIREFLRDQFEFESYIYEDLERLSTHYNDKVTYKKIVNSLDFDIPEDFNGNKFEAITHNIGDVDKIKEKLELQKGIAAVLTADPGMENDFLSMFFNRFTEDLESKVEEQLMERSDDDIKDLCRCKGIRIGIGSTKASLIKKILHELKLDTKRIVEYEQSND